jgi:MFS family permease
MDQAHDPYAALRIADYRRLLAGNMLVSIGNQMQRVAIGWELYERTHANSALGYVGLVLFLPVIFVSLPAGHAADRYSRKGLLLTALCLSVVGSSSLALLSFWQGPIPLVYVSLLVLGMSQAVNAPARWSWLPQIVPLSVLGNAITWNTSGWQVASIIGPALGGLVIAVSGKALWVYLLAGCCSVTVMSLYSTIRPGRQAERSRETVSLRSFLAGLHYVAQNKLILATITLDLFAVLLGGATALLPSYAKDILKIGPDGLGWLQAAPSMGAFLMALVLAHRPPLRRAGPTLLWSVAGFGVATIVFGFSSNVLLSFLMLVVTGALDNVSMVVRGTLVQGLTPDAMRGRVSAVNAIFIGSSNELGAFESGMTAHWFGLVPSVVGGGIGTLAVVATVMFVWPEVARLGSLQDVKRLVAEESPVPT